MNIHEKLTQQQLLEIVIHSCRKGNNREIVEVGELVREIRNQILLICAEPGGDCS